MKRVVVLAGLMLSYPCSLLATVAGPPEKSTTIVVAEPLVTFSSAIVTVYNLHDLRQPSALWGGVGLSLGVLSAVIAASDDAELPGAAVTIGAAGIFVGLTRLHAHPQSSGTSWFSTGIEVGLKSARLVARF